MSSSSGKNCLRTTFNASTSIGWKNKKVKKIPCYTEEKCALVVYDILLQVNHNIYSEGEIIIHVINYKYLNPEITVFFHFHKDKITLLSNPANCEGKYRKSDNIVHSRSPIIWRHH